MVDVSFSGIIAVVSVINLILVGRKYLPGLFGETCSGRMWQRDIYQGGTVAAFANVSILNMEFAKLAREDCVENVIVASTNHHTMNNR